MSPRAIEPRSPPCASTPLNTCCSAPFHAGSWPLARESTACPQLRVCPCRHGTRWCGPKIAARSLSPTHAHEASALTLSPAQSFHAFTRAVATPFLAPVVVRVHKTKRATRLRVDRVPLTRKPRPPCTCLPTAISHVQTTPTPESTLTACDAREVWVHWHHRSGVDGHGRSVC
jgi:hypothetical protein